MCVLVRATHQEPRSSCSWAGEGIPAGPRTFKGLFEGVRLGFRSGLGWGSVRDGGLVGMGRLRVKVGGPIHAKDISKRCECSQEMRHSLARFPSLPNERLLLGL